jgi:hypothetical protein
MRTLTPVPIEFLDRAPVRVTRTGVINAPLPAVFAAYADRPEDWKRWCPGFTGGEWTTPEREVGAVRRMKAGTRTIEETVLVHERDKRWVFAVSALNAPLLRGLAEDYVFERLPGGQTQLTWTIAADVPGPAVANRLAVDATMRLLMAGAAKKLPKSLSAASSG